MSWADAYEFEEPMQDLRHDSGSAQPFADELARELAPGHVLHGRAWKVIARALPQDEVVVEAGDNVALVHLTWSGKSETPPWPTVKRTDSRQEFAGIIESATDARNATSLASA